MHTILDIALLSVLAFSVLSNFYGFPGNLLIAAGNLFYGAATGFREITISFVIIIFCAVLFIEFVEFLLIAFTARKYGSSKWGIFGAIVGGIIGAISGTYFSPLPGVIIGSSIGVFLGAFLLELFNNSNVKQSLLSGFGAFLGRVGGLSIKMIGAVTMASMILLRII